MHTRSILLLVTAGLLVGGCAKDEAASSDLYRQPPALSRTDEAAGNAADVTVTPNGASPTAPATAPEQGAPSTALPNANQAAGSDSAAPSAVPAMIIRTGTATVQVDSLERAVAQVKQLAERLGGYIANSSTSTGTQNVRSASLEVKLPSAQWDRALAGLEPLGKLESQQATAEDVGEEFVDVSARVANSRRLEERLIGLLATRTGKLDDVLAVERELARVREEIERYDGRLRYLRSRVALSTLTVTLHEPYPTLGPGSNPIVDAFRTAWRNFIGFVAGFIASLGWLVPLLAIVAAVVWVLRRMLPRRGPKGTTPAPQVAPAQPPPPSAS